MSGFWAGSIPQWGWLEIALFSLFFLVAGLGVGSRHGRRRAERDQAERREEARAARWLRQVRPRPPEVHHQDPRVAHEAWLAHTEQAMDVANDDPTVSAWTQQMAESMDQWIQEHVYGVPYSADELWSGQ